MANLSTFILLLLGPRLFLFHSVTTDDPDDPDDTEDLSQIIWAPPDTSLDTSELLEAFLNSSYHIARSFIVKGTTEEYMVLGKNNKGRLKLSTCLETVSRDKKAFQELFLDVQWKSHYDLAVKELEQVPGSKDWVTLSMRLWQGPTGWKPDIKPLQMKGSQMDNVRKCFVLSYANRPGSGYSEELIRRVKKDFQDNEFSSIPNLTLSFDIHDVSKTTLSNLDALGHVMGLTNRVLLFTRESYPPKHVDMARLMYCVRTYLQLKQCYLHVRKEFREGMFRYLTTTASTTTLSTTTKSTQSTTISTTEYTDYNKTTILDDVSSSEPHGGGVLGMWWRTIIIWIVTIGML